MFGGKLIGKSSTTGTTIAIEPMPLIFQDLWEEACSLGAVNIHTLWGTYDVRSRTYKCRIKCITATGSEIEAASTLRDDVVVAIGDAIRELRLIIGDNPKFDHNGCLIL